jgi:transposase, IS30 family
MHMTYSHLTQDERYQISNLKAQHLSIAAIAQTLKRHRSTISREIQRNACSAGNYQATQAHTLCTARLSARRNARQFKPAHWAHVEHYLRLSLSPQQVSGRLLAEQALSISTECIYLYVYKNNINNSGLISYLRCQKRNRKRYASGRQRRGSLKDRICIEQRPAVVDAKSRLGDWEGDTVIGAEHQGVLVTLAERKSRYTLVKRVHSKHAQPVGDAVIELLRPHRKHCHTLTFDNGKEFAQHAFMAKCLQAKVYFAHPYCSWERGLNENTNGLLRQYFPKGTNFTKVSDDEVNDAVYKLNHRPRKCLQYRTPHEVFYGLKMKPIKLLDVALCT